MTEIIPSLSEWLASKKATIEQRHNENLRLTQTISQNVALSGRDLSEVRDKLKPLKQWVSWCDTLAISYKSVTNYIAYFEAYGCETVSYDGFILRDLYAIAKQPDPQKLLEAKTKAQSGKQLKEDELNIILDYEGVESSDVRIAWHNANSENPKIVSESLGRGAMIDVDGDDKPISKVDATQIKVISNEEKYERTMRQKIHIQEKAKDDETLPIEGTVQAIHDNHGNICFAIVLSYDDFALLNTKWKCYPMKAELAKASGQ